MKSYLVFALLNISLVLTLWFAIVSPRLTGISNSLLAIELQDRREALEQVETNEEIDKGGLLYYSDLAEGLGDVYSLARNQDLTQLMFTLLEPRVISQSDGHALYEVSIRARYSGEFSNVASFLSELNSGVPVVESFVISMAQEATLDIEIIFVKLG